MGLCLIVARAEAEDFYNGDATASSVGFEFEQFKGGESPIGTQGAMLGIRDSSYIMHSHHVSLGGAIYFGTPHGGDLARDNLLYGGLVSSIDMSVFHIFNLSFSVLAGYGYGNSNISGGAGQSIVLQPSVSVGFVLINGYRASFTMGHVYMPNASGFSGRTYGIRIEQKSESYPAVGVDY